MKKTSFPAKFAQRIWPTYCQTALTFGLEICSIPRVTLDKLQKIQNEMCRAVLRAPRHAHIAVMHNELGIRTLRDIIDTNTVNYFNRTINLPKTRLVRLIVLEQCHTVTVLLDSLSLVAERERLVARGWPPMEPHQEGWFLQTVQNGDWMGDPTKIPDEKTRRLTGRLAPFMVKVIDAAANLGVPYYLNNKRAVKVRSRLNRLEQFKHLVVNSERLQHLEDKINPGPTEIDCRNDSVWWLRARQGWIHPFGWKVGETICQACRVATWDLPHLLWSCPALDYPSIMEASGRSGGRRSQHLHRHPMHLTALSQRWWLSMNRSPWERKIYGTYIRTACTFERRYVEELRHAGIPPIILAVPIPRINIDLALPGRVGIDAGDVGGVGDPLDPLDPLNEDVAEDRDDPRLLTAG